MDLRDRVEFPSKIYSTQLLKNKLAVATNCELTELEILLFNKAMLAVSQQLVKEGIQEDNLDCLIVFFTENGDLNLYEDTASGCGLHFAMAIYIMERIRKYNSNVFTTFAFIEEMTHHYWHISDERLVKYKVEEIFQIIDPEFTLDYMRKRWKLNGL